MASCIATFSEIRLIWLFLEDAATQLYPVFFIFSTKSTVRCTLKKCRLYHFNYLAKELGVSVTDLMEFGEGISNSFNKNKGTNTVICSPDSQDILIELTRLKTENEGLKREMLRLEKIISLLEEKSVLISSV